MSQDRLVWIGRVATGVMVLIGLAWIPVIQGGKGLYDYLQGVQAYLAPPIFVVFFLGYFLEATERRRLPGGTDRRLPAGPVPPGRRHAGQADRRTSSTRKARFLWIVNNMFFQYYSILILIVCVIVMVVVSYATRAAATTRRSPG